MAKGKKERNVKRKIGEKEDRNPRKKENRRKKERSKKERKKESFQYLIPFQVDIIALKKAHTCSAPSLQEGWKKEGREKDKIR